MKKRIFIIVLLVLLIGGPIWFFKRTIYKAPAIFEADYQFPELEQIDSTTYKMGANWLRKNKYGNWECYVEGSPFERGVILGRMQKQLIEKQEAVFVAEIKNKVPNSFFRGLLQYGISWFNRDLNDQVPREFLEEIYGVSLSFSDDYDFIGPKFNRILNYHAAHDIGHMAQNMNLVACSAIAQWDYTNPQTPHLLLGRNFDFYFGDDFAKNKIVLFCKPDSGYAFTSVTWGGFCGVVSGMNQQGLTVTLNALPSEVPTVSETPVSIVAREVLQYASTIKEALQIVEKSKVFVSESFTIVSAKDKMAAVIEKTPEGTGIFYPAENQLIVTNHFQSEPFNTSQINVEHMANSESTHRFNRLAALSAQADSDISTTYMARFLRDRKGEGDKEIGLGNPMAINQFLAHHAVIFDAENKLAYITAAPYQENVFVAYDVNNMAAFSHHNPRLPLEIDSLTIAPDSFYQTAGYQKLLKYRQTKTAFLAAQEANEDSVFTKQYLADFIELNPHYYEAYKLVGDYYLRQEKTDQANAFYAKALDCEIPYKSDRENIQNLINKGE